MLNEKGNFIFVSSQSYSISNADNCVEIYDELVIREYFKGNDQHHFNGFRLEFPNGKQKNKNILENRENRVFSVFLTI